MISESKDSGSLASGSVKEKQEINDHDWLPQRGREERNRVGRGSFTETDGTLRRTRGG